MASIEEISNLLASKLDDVFERKLGIEEGETLASKLDDVFESKLDDVFERKLGIGKDATVDLPKMERRLDAIAAVSPDAALEEVRPNVVGYGTIHEKRAMTDGALATWTFFKSGDKKLAVSAAHCAFPYRVNTDGSPHLRGYMFVEIPVEIRTLVTGVYFYEEYLSRRNQESDIAVLELDSFPARVVEALVEEWESTQTPPRANMVAGWSLSGSVRGRGCVQEPFQKIISFVEDSGEAGQSGTAMRTIPTKSGENKKTFGIYLGLGDKKLWDLKPRGRILKLPDFNNDFTRAAKIEFQKVPRDNHGKRTVKVQALDKNGREIRKSNQTYCFDETGFFRMIPARHQARNTSGFFIRFPRDN